VIDLIALVNVFYHSSGKTSHPAAPKTTKMTKIAPRDLNNTSAKRSNIVISILYASRESYIRALGFALKLLLKYEDFGAKIVL
jgi:uncharacterized membrane protein